MKNEVKPRVSTPSVSKPKRSAAAIKELAALKGSAVNRGHTRGSFARVKARIAALEGAA